MINYYISVLTLVSAVSLQCTESLSLMRTLAVGHSPGDAQAIYYGYHWLSDNKLFTHKYGDYKRIWDIEKTAENPVRVTQEHPLWDELSAIAQNKKPNKNRELERGILSQKIERCDEQTYAILNKKAYDSNDTNGTDGWEVVWGQSTRERLFLRPDGKQHIITELEEEDSEYARETISVYDSITQKPLQRLTSRTFAGGDFPIKQSLKFDWSPDSEKLAVVDTYHPWDNHGYKETMQPETITLYNSHDFSVNRSFEVESGHIREISVSPNSAFLAAYTENYIDRQQAIHIWNIVRGYLVATLMNENYGKRNPLGLGETTNLNNIWNPSSTKIATYNAVGNIDIYKLPQE